MFAMSDQMLQSSHRPMLPIYRKWKSNAELAPNCPRCASANTKFCYYNNYSLSQPRYFCKGCRRYWTKGGSLRNVPVGGGCRKTRRGKSSSRSDNNQVIPMNYTTNSNSTSSGEEQMIGTSSSSDGDSGNQLGPATGSDIDLAVIFSQLVNQSTSSEQHELLTQEWPNEGIIDQWSFLEQDTNSQNDYSSMELLPVVHPIPEYSYMLEEVPQLKQHLKEGLMLETEEMNEFGLQNVLADDVYWSNYEANTPSFECQPKVQLQQQLESFPVDDQLKISANLMPENWSSFDLSGFELFSKP